MSTQGYINTAPTQGPAQLADYETDIRDRSLVENRITGLLSQDNPYMRQAETRGLQQANARGLISSSMAVGAVEGQRIAAALPIAQQDASLYGQADLQDSAYRQQGNLNTQNYTNSLGTISHQGSVQSGLQYQQGDINSRLQSEQGNINSRLQGEQGNINSRLQSEQGTISSRLQAEQGRISGTLQSQQGNINSRLQSEQGRISSDLNAQQIAGNSQLQRETATQNAQAQLQATIANINSDPNKSASQRTADIADATAVYNSISSINTTGGQLANSNYIYVNSPSPAASSTSTAERVANATSYVYPAATPSSINSTTMQVNSARGRYPPPDGYYWKQLAGDSWRLTRR